MGDYHPSEIDFGIAGAFVTAFYMARAVALIFHGTYKGEGHPHESPPILTRPLVALAIPAIFVGFLNIPGVSWPGIGNFTEWLAVRVVPMGDYHPSEIDFGIAALGLGAAFLGLAVGWRLFARDRPTQAARDTFEVPLLYPLLRRKYYLDDVALGVVGATQGPLARAVNWTNDYIIDGVVNGTAIVVRSLGRFVYDTMDQLGVDGIFNGLSAITDALGGGVRKWQTGRVQQYAAALVAGALVLVVVFVLVT
jgi:NADH-quinone oxidoreductase subunit L